MFTSLPPSACTVRYAAGIDCRNVEVGVMGDRNESVTFTEPDEASEPLIRYVRLVVEASKVAPRYIGKATWKRLSERGRESSGLPRSGNTMRVSGMDAITEKPSYQGRVVVSSGRQPGNPPIGGDDAG